PLVKRGAEEVPRAVDLHFAVRLLLGARLADGADDAIALRADLTHDRPRAGALSPASHLGHSPAAAKSSPMARSASRSLRLASAGARARGALDGRSLRGPQRWRRR